jgi:hypothetical protein
MRHEVEAPTVVHTIDDAGSPDVPVEIVTVALPQYGHSVTDGAKHLRQPGHCQPWFGTVWL